MAGTTVIPKTAAVAAEATAMTTESELVVAATSKKRSKAKQTSGKAAISVVLIATTAAASGTITVETKSPTPTTKEQLCDWNFASSNSCRFFGLERRACDFDGCEVIFHSSCKNRWKYDNNMTIDHMTGYCRHHHPNYAKEGSPTKPATVGQALSAVAPDKNVDQPSTPSPGKRRGEKEKHNVTSTHVLDTAKVASVQAKVAAVASIQSRMDP